MMNVTKFKKKVSIILMAVILFTMIPSFTITAQKAGNVFDYAELATAAKISGNGDIVLGANISGTVQLNIERNLTLDLNGKNLDITVSIDNGIKIGNGVALTIIDSVNAGVLKVHNSLMENSEDISGNGAAINTTSATLIVNSGKVIAEGGSGGAGIGGGYNAGGTNIGNSIIIINGGTVVAKGGSGGAGIGGGFGLNSGTIIINNGTVEATGGSYSAGIGAGNYGNSRRGIIEINGGTVTATGGSDRYFRGRGGVGMGGGTIPSGSGGGDPYPSEVGNGDILITGGTVTATGGRGEWTGTSFDGQNRTLEMRGGIITAANGIMLQTVITGNAEIQSTSFSINSGEGVAVDIGATLTISDRLTQWSYRFINNGTIINNGLIENMSNCTFYNYGTLINNGEFRNTGTVVNYDTISNYGTIGGYGSIFENQPIEPPIKAIINGLNITVTPNRPILENEIIIVSLYGDGGQLLEIRQIKQDDSLTVAVSRLAEAKTIKIMWWNGMNTMQPICGYDILINNNGSEWIRPITE